MTPPANHPPACTRCAGTGWQPGPPIHATAQGQPIAYTTVTPCTHIWWDDELFEPDPELTVDETLARLAAVRATLERMG
jgi:hypothetical protein